MSPRFRSAAMIESVTVVFPTPLAGAAMMKALLSFCSSWIAGSLAMLLSPMNFLSPPIREDQIIQRNSREPSGNFQFRPWQKLAHKPQTKISNWNYPLGNFQHPPEFSSFEEAHTSDAD